VAIEIADHGARNRVEIAPDVLADGVGEIIITGDDSQVVIGAGVRLAGAKIQLGNRCSFTAAANSNLAKIQVFAKTEGRASIGALTAFTMDSRLWLHEPGAITIGERCIIASLTLLTVSDMHSIFDLESGERINPPRDVIVEDDVWLGREAMLLKGAHVGRGSVIGLRAVVTGAIPPHCIAAGIPARVIRENVRWQQ